MPEKVLELLQTCNFTEQQLARQLHLTPEELQACLEYLQHLGLIKSTRIHPTAGSCSGNCSKCKGCNNTTASDYTLWEIA